MEPTWDGLPTAQDPPHGCVVVVRRRGRPCAHERPPGDAVHEYLVLHRAGEGRDVEGDWAWTSPSGGRRPDEPVYAAALRELHEEAGITDADVWAVDLSGPWAMFACEVADEVKVTLHDVEHDRYEWLAASEARSRILPGHVGDRQVGRVDPIPPAVTAVRPMTRADFPDVVRWVREPHVARWWDADEAADVHRAERHYGPALDGDDPTRMWVVEVNGRSVGFVQDYRIGDHPEYALLTAQPEAIGFDYAIGDPAWVGKGVGTRVLWTFLRDVVRPHYPEAGTIFAAPDHRNLASLRVLEKLGFTQGPWFDEPKREGRVDTVIGCSLDVARVFGRQ